MESNVKVDVGGIKPRCMKCAHEWHNDGYGKCRWCECGGGTSVAFPPGAMVNRGWTPEEAATRDERASSYGPPIVSHTNIGRGWGALLDHAQWRGGDVPPHLVAAMMASLKLCRGVTHGGKFNDDTWVDGAVYCKFGGEFAPRGEE